MAYEYAHLIERFGYAATFAGTLLEGETLLILSGVAANAGLLSLPVVVAIGATGGMLGDLFFFLLGRRYGGDLLARFPRFAPVASRVHAMIERYPAATVVAVRFMYGMRTAGPAVIGTTRLPLPAFALLNAIGALVWSACWVCAGFVLGKAAEHLLGDIARVERDLLVVVLVVAIAVGVGVYVWRRGRRRG